MARKKSRQQSKRKEQRAERESVDTVQTQPSNSKEHTYISYWTPSAQSLDNINMAPSDGAGQRWNDRDGWKKKTKKKQWWKKNRYHPNNRDDDFHHGGHWKQPPNHHYGGGYGNNYISHGHNYFNGRYNHGKRNDNYYPDYAYYGPQSHWEEQQHFQGPHHDHGSIQSYHDHDRHPLGKFNGPGPGPHGDAHSDGQQDRQGPQSQEQGRPSAFVSA